MGYKMKTIELYGIQFEYYFDDNINKGDITNIYYQNEDLEIYYSTYWCDVVDEAEIIAAIEQDYETRIKRG